MTVIHLQILKGAYRDGLKAVLSSENTSGYRVNDRYDVATGSVLLQVPAQTAVEDDCDRRAGGLLAGYIRTLKPTAVALLVRTINKSRIWTFVEGLAIALAAGQWSEKNKQNHLYVSLYVSARNWDESAYARICALCDALERARWLVSAPPNRQGPEQLAQQAATIFEDCRSVSCLAYGDHWLQEERFNLLRAVASGGRQPVLIHAHYKPSGRRKSMPRIVLIGKGVTFDSGGLDIKPAASMLEMKRDMAGAAAVLAVIRYAAQRQLPVELHALAPAVENLVDAQSMRPSDVYTARNGVTVEITNTDAEGRLILADTLVWSADTLNADATIDVATLTGAAAMVGGWHTVAVSRSAELGAQILAAAMASGERAIGLPLWAEYDRELRSEIADWKNSSNTRYAGTISGGAFLSKFAPANWVHLDIAANAWTQTRRDYLPLGATGAGVRTLAYWLEALCEG